MILGSYSLGLENANDVNVGNGLNVIRILCVM